MEDYDEAVIENIEIKNENEEDEYDIDIESSSTDTEKLIPQTAKFIFIPKEERMSSNFLTKYEEARLISVRSQQIAKAGHKVFIEERTGDCKLDAMRELDEQKIPLLLFRKVDEDEETKNIYVEVWDPKEMNRN